MSERKIDLEELKNYLLSPGDIFWIKNSGAKVVVSKKGELTNFNLIQKILNSHQSVVIDNEVDKNILFESRELFQAYKKELIFKEKGIWKRRIFEFLKKNFIDDGLSQFELNLILWSWFSNVEFDEAAILLSKDRDLFIRAMDVAGASTLVAWLAGYYQEGYLAEIYSRIFLGFKDLIENELLISAKNHLEDNRLNIEQDFYFKNKAIDKNNICFEKNDGTGMHGYHATELSDFESCVRLINDSISYHQLNKTNILQLIRDDKVILDIRMKKYIKEELLQANTPVAA